MHSPSKASICPKLLQITIISFETIFFINSISLSKVICGKIIPSIKPSLKNFLISISYIFGNKIILS